MLHTPPETIAAPPERLSFVLGRDHGGHWIVIEMHGLYGGLFTSKDAAMRYAKFETAERSGAIEFTDELLELRFSDQSTVTSDQNPVTDH